MIASIEFNEAWYLAQNPDVRAAVEAGSFHSALQHFEMYGKQEGRSPSPLFDPAFYLAENPDVAAAVERGDMTAYDHFAAFGTSEGRSPSPLFDPDFYLEHNPDVAAAVRRGETTALEHFLNYGRNEGRPLTPAIDMGAYLDANPDVADAVAQGQVNGLEHLLLYGIGEGRDLGNGVDLSWFDDDAVFQEALVHGDAWAAWARVESVAPFFESFTGPEGWAPEEGAAPPADYTPPEGVGMVDAGDGGEDGEGGEGGAAGPDPDPDPEPEPEAPDPDEDPDDDPDDPGPDPAVFNTAHEVRLSTDSQQATIDFESVVIINTADLKAAIRVRVDGESFQLLGVADSATVIGGNLVITFAEPVRSNDLAFEIAPGALRDGSGAVNGRIETSALDNLPPAAPAVGLLADTGDSGTDGITNDGTVSVTPAEEGGHWEYSTDGGVNWQAGTGAGFVLDEGQFDADAVQVRQTDAAGNVGEAAKLGAVTIDMTAPAAPVVELAQDTGTLGDGITNSAALTDPTGVEIGAQLEYRVDGGLWSAGYAAPTADGEHAVEVRQTDVAGNVSPIQTITFTLDATAPQVESIHTSADGLAILINYNEVVTAASGLSVETFDLKVNGSAAVINTVNVSGKVVTLGLAEPVLYRQDVLLSQEPGALLDVAGNAAPAITGDVVTNQAENTFTVTEDEGVWMFGGTAIGDIVMSVDVDGKASFVREDIDAANRVPLSESSQSQIRVDEGVNLKVAGAALHALDVMFVGEGSVDVTDLELTQAGWTESEAHGVRVTDDIDIAKVLFASLLDEGAATLTVNDGISDYIKLGWIYLDQDYYSQSAEKGLEAAYYNTSLTVAKAELALLYVDHLDQGGPAFTDFLGKTAGDGASPTRAQSIHDNLLGELGRATLQDRLSANKHTAQTPHEAYPALDDFPSWSELLDFYLDRTGEYADRPYVGGYSNKQADQVNGALWDMAHGIERPDFNKDADPVLVAHNHDGSVLGHKAGDLAGLAVFSDSAHSGDTVYVAAGEYQGELVLTVPALSLQGVNAGVAAADRMAEPGEESVINGATSNYGIHAEGASVTGQILVDGFTVMTGAQGGIGQFRSASEGTAIFRNNIVLAGDESFGSHGNAIQISGQNSQVTDNYLETAVYVGEGSTDWSTSGITVVKDASGSLISGNTVLLSADSTLDDTHHTAYGIALDGHYGVLTGITVSNNTVSDLTAGLSLLDHLGGEVEDEVISVYGNSFTGNAYAIGLGTTTTGWEDVLYIDISDNTFSGSGFADIAFFEFEEGSVTIGVNDYSGGDIAAIWFSEDGIYGDAERTVSVEIDISSFASDGVYAQNVLVSSGMGFGELKPTYDGGNWVVSGRADTAFEHLEITLVGGSSWSGEHIAELFAITPQDAG